MRFLFDANINLTVARMAHLVKSDDILYYKCFSGVGLRMDGAVTLAVFHSSRETSLTTTP